MRKKKFFCSVFVCIFFVMSVASSWACSIAGATGNATTDGRPVIWKNRDSWGTENCWKTFAYHHKAPSNSDTDKYNYVGVTDADTKIIIVPEHEKSIDKGKDDITDKITNKVSDKDIVKKNVDVIDESMDKIQEKNENSTIDIIKDQLKPHPQYSYKYFPWAGANEKGLGLVQTSVHTLSKDFQEDEGFTPDQDPDGIDNKTLNHLILCGCETVDEVEELLRDTNDGCDSEGHSDNNITARDTNSIIMVFDKDGCMATFEVSGSDFTRDNVESTYVSLEDQYYPDHGAIYPQVHNDDKDAQNPETYNGFDWRTNFSKVDYERADGFEFFVDEHRTEIENNDIVNWGEYPDGIDDREYSTSSIKRYGRIGIRMDDPHDKDYKYFIQKYVGSYGLPITHDIESVARSIGDLPSSSSEKATGWHINRFCTTFSVVITGSKTSDPDDGKLATIWLAQGEPANSIFIPIMPFAGEPPEILDDMYIYNNEKRRQVYDYEDTDGDGDDNECDGYSNERNADHNIDLNALTGNHYYGSGGIQQSIFILEDWAYSQYGAFINHMRTQLEDNSMSDDELRQELKEWQEFRAKYMKERYIGRTVPQDNIEYPDPDIEDHK